jgi:predicted membrane-bound spermidine synthase
MNSRIRTLYVLFTVSGFCGLIYESIWSHYLKLFLGHAAYAQTVVLIVFIGGLALGSWLAGAFALRVRRPLLAYAAAEFIVGVTAMLFHWIFVGSTNWAYDVLLPMACSADSWCWAQWAFAALLILPQSILLGTTFPLMTGGILRLDPTLPGGKLSLLYFLNSIGAVVGVLASGFLLIPAVGLPGALATAGICNIFLAMVVYMVDKNTDPAARVEPDAADTREATPDSLVAWLLIVALVTGLSSFIYEVAWIRSLSLVLSSSTHSFELMLASFILGLALGGLWIRKRIDRIADPVRFLAVVQVLMGIFAVLTLPVYAGTFDLMSWFHAAVQKNDPGWILYNVYSQLLCLLVMLPATFLAGMTLPLITSLLMRSRLGEKSIGKVYAANTLGAIVGVIVAVHFALPFLGLKGALVLGGAIDVALGVILLARNRGIARGFRAGWSAAGVAGIAAVALFYQLDPLRLASGVYIYGMPTLSKSYEILFHRDGKTATVDVTRANPDGVISIRTNGKSDGAMAADVSLEGAGGDEYTMILLGLYPLAHVPKAKSAAVIGYGTGMSTATLLSAPGIERVDTIEIEPAMVEGARFFRPFTDANYEDPRSHIIYDDAKSYFARSKRKYDIILSEPSNPWVSGVSSLFTREFYARVRGQLNPGGVLVQWVHTYAFNEALMASIVRAMRESFPEYVVYAANNGDLIFVASPSGPVPPLSSEMIRTGRIPKLLERLEMAGETDLLVRRVGDHNSLGTLLRFYESPANSDYFPVVDNRAAKARFTQAQAVEVRDLSVAPWPILDLAGVVPAEALHPITMARFPAGERVRESQGADAARRYLLGEIGPVEAKKLVPKQFIELSMFKLRFIDCVASAPMEQWWDAAVVTAALVNAYLPPEVASRVWDKVQKSPCHAKLDARTRDWIRVFRSVGSRDATTMAELGEAMLVAKAHGSATDLEYLLGTAMLGRIKLGQREEAARLYDKYGKEISVGRLNTAWYKWLRNSVIRHPQEPSAASMPRAPKAPSK